MDCLSRWARTSALAAALSCLAATALGQEPGAAPPPAPDSAADPGAQPPADAQPEPEDDASAEEEPTDGEDAQNGAEGEGTGVRGTVVDATTGEPIIEGAVEVVGRSRRVYTDIDGNFSIDLPPGRYTLRSFYELYQPARLENVVVRRNQRTVVEIRLSADSESVQEVVVTARADTATAATQLTIRREAPAVRDAVSAEEIRRSPDSSAGDAARRIVAATVVGQYLFVRGLGGRYTTVLLNGVELPSTDPDRPGVQLDLFPAALLNSISILKTFTPDLPGNFAGGSMLITTRDFPSRFTLGVSASLGYNTETTFRDGLRYDGGSTDWLGVDDGSRSLPASIPSSQLQSLDRDQARAAARGFSGDWRVREDLNLPDFRLAVNAGDTLDVDGHFLGYLLAFSYGLAFRDESEDVVRPGGDGMGGVVLSADDIDRQSLDQQVTMAALGSATYEVADGQQLSLTTLFTQVADDVATFNAGHDGMEDNDFARRDLLWLERTVWFNVLSGQHRNLFGEWRLDWRLNATTSSRTEPDHRNARYGLDSNGYFWSEGSGGGASRFFSDLDALDVGGGIDLSIPIETLTLELGGALNRTGREYTSRSFRYAREKGADPASNRLPPEQLFAPESIGTNVYVREATEAEDGYEASQIVVASYAMADWSTTSWLRVIGGVRAESMRQVVESSSPFAPLGAMPVRDTHRTYVDLLPAAGVVLRVSDQMAVRSAYSATIARPQLRELAPFLYEDFVRQRAVQGNPDLRRTRIQNLDLRWEWFPSEDEVIAFSGFAKFFTDAIEPTVLDFGGTYGFTNSSSARNLGVEAEARVGLDRFVGALDAFSVGANLTIVDSQVELTREEAGRATTLRRPLAGQSPYVANVSLGCAPPDTGVSVFLYYNVFGRRLTEVGVMPLPDVYERPFHSFDLVGRWDITDHFSLKASIKNLLLQTREYEQGGVVFRRDDPGLSASLQLGWTH